MVVLTLKSNTGGMSFGRIGTVLVELALKSQCYVHQIHSHCFFLQILPKTCSVLLNTMRIFVIKTFESWEGNK